MINKKAVLPDGKIFSLRREEKKDTEQALRLILSDCVDRICIKVDNIYNSYLNQKDENNHSLRWLAHDRIEHSRTESRSSGQSCP